MSIPAETLSTAASTAPPDVKTTAGNYFVANYPPFSFWRPERKDEALNALAQPPNPGTPLGIYLHLPFCRKRCHFCYFKVYTGRDAKNDRVRAYVEAVLDELEIYARSPLVAGRRPRYVYFGGGTPSFLSPDELGRLFHGMKRLLPWDDVEEVTFECEPGTLNDEKLSTLRNLGVTRLSLGIENFDDEILRMIAGMLNETETNWRECVRKAIELAADCVTVYQMEIPFNTTIYQQMHEQGQIVAPVADWPTKRAWVDYAFTELERAGYTVTSAYTAVRQPQTFRFLYRDYLWQGADMVALGVSSFGHLRGTHYQNEKDIQPYFDRLKRQELPIQRALCMTEEEKLVREVILQMKRGRLERAYFREKFSTDILTRFAPALDRLRQSGYVSLDAGGVLVARPGLLRVDELLQEFFLPQHQHARYT
jgi:oxygen-independent coproporphyrinogen-3 oxidase